MTEDRHMVVPPGYHVVTDYVNVWAVRLACRERIAVGDVDTAYRRLLQQDGKARWPCPNGHWEVNEFVIEDGRHEWLASVMIGYTHILVAWLEAL